MHNLKKCVLVLSFLISGPVFAFQTELPPLQESPAFKQFSKQPQTELAKLIFLLNRFKESKVTVVYDSHSYPAPDAVKKAMNYLKRHYHKETAEYWIRNYCHKTKSGKEILLKNSTAETRSALNFALDELKKLETAL